MRSTNVFYSVEYKPKKNPFPTFPVAWGQYVLTPSRFRARLYHFELRLSKGRTNHTRIRKV